MAIGLARQGVGGYTGLDEMLERLEQEPAETGLRTFVFADDDNQYEVVADEGLTELVGIVASDISGIRKGQEKRETYPGLVEQLLEGHSSMRFADACLAAVKKDPPPELRYPRGPTPVDEIRRDYEERTSRPKENQPPSEGSDELYAALEHLPADTGLLAHDLWNEKYQFQIYTDEAVTQLFGIIAIDIAESRKHIKTSLVKVLAANGSAPYAVEALAAAEAGDPADPVYYPVGPAEIGQLKHVYGVRARMATAKKFPAHGLTELVAELDKEPETTRVYVHDLEDGNYKFQVFTDDAMTRLLGIVAIGG